MLRSDRRIDIPPDDPAPRVQVEAGTAAHAADRRGAFDRFEGSFVHSFIY